MKPVRGMIVVVAAKGDASGRGDTSDRARPFLVVQSDLFSDHATISLCPLSRAMSDTGLFRVSLEASPETGLACESEIQVDRLEARDRGEIVRIIGTIPITTMTRVDDALRRWLEL